MGRGGAWRGWPYRYKGRGGKGSHAVAGLLGYCGLGITHFRPCFIREVAAKGAWGVAVSRLAGLLVSPGCRSLGRFLACVSGLLSRGLRDLEGNLVFFWSGWNVRKGMLATGTHGCALANIQVTVVLSPSTQPSSLV